MPLRTLVKLDLERYRWRDGLSPWRALLLKQGAQASLVYRFGHCLHRPPQRRTSLAWLPLRIFYRTAAKLIEVTTGISISPAAVIGPGLYIPHFGGIVIGPCRLGSYCNVSHGVTIGTGGRGEQKGSPSIGDRVYIGPGAKVFGPITIGDDVAIGANAVVNRSLPDRAVAVGVPAKIVSRRGSFEFVGYRGMEQDPLRLASLASRESEATDETALHDVDLAVGAM